MQGCHIFDNGIERSGLEHNVYTAGIGMVFQNNRFGPLRAGCPGNNFKDRSAGLVFRYNWVEGGNKGLDLVDAQDSKLIRLDRSGKVRDFAMNDRCAAGTGKFLEFMATALQVDLEDFGAFALRADKRIQINSMCTVFAESEVVSLIAEGTAVPEISRGLHRAIASRTGVRDTPSCPAS